MAANAPHDDLDTAGSQARDKLVAGIQFAVLTGWLASKLRSTHSMRAMSNRAEMITETVTLEYFPEAFEALRQRSAQRKVMLAPWSGNQP